MPRFLLALALLLLPAAGHAQAQTGSQPSLTVFAAASLTDALKDVSAAWAQQGHPALKLSFASSSTLARQIAEGAPADVFASADEKWMDYLAQRNLLAPETRKDLLGNSLVLIVPSDHARQIEVGPGLDLDALLGSQGRIATGDPAHVPVGIYAEQALKKLGLWAKAEPRLAPTEDVRGALLLVERGEAPAGIVYSTDAATTKAVAIAGTFPVNSHDPITYPFALTKQGDTAEGKALMQFLQGPEARKIFAARGFQVE